MEVKLKFNDINVKEEKEKTLVKVLMLKGEKGDTVSAKWGTISGTITEQTDLKNALDSKANQSDMTNALNSKANASDLNNYYTKSQIDTSFASTLGTQDIVDRLDSTADDKVLAASQGKILNDKINDINKKIYIVDLNSDNLQTVINNAANGSIILCNGIDESDTLYTITKDLTIIGGHFILTPRECTSEDYGVKVLFRIEDCNVIIDNITLEAETYDENPYIYVRENAEITNQTDSNIELVSCYNSNITIKNSIIKNCIVCYGSHSNINLINNNVITSMFVFGSTNNVESKSNTIEIQESNLTSYYHVYYLDTNSIIKISNDNIISNSLFFDVIHTGVSQETGGLNCNVHNTSIVGKFKRLSQGNDLTLNLYNCNLYLRDLEIIAFPNNITNSNISFNSYINEDLKISNLTWANGKTIGSNGNIIDNPDRQVSNSIAVDFKYYVALDNPDLMIAFYDSENTFISRSVPRYFTEIPSNAKTYRFSRANDLNYRFIKW